MKECNSITRCNSILHRMSQAFYDREMQPFQLGNGQQFFLLRVEENPGISFQELAHSGNYDKATATRAVRKLEEEAYVRLECDANDKRVRHIYLTDKAKPVIKATRKSTQEWLQIVTDGLGEKEVEAAANLMEHMMQNACTYINQQRLQEHERS